MRRLAVLACVALSGLAAAPTALADNAAVPAPSQTEVVDGRTIVFGAHGDRIPPGSDARMRRLERRLPRISSARLPSGWCGTERATDDAVHASFSGPRFKVVYAYPADEPNRFAQYRDMIQDDVATVSEWVIASSGGTKSVRFDTGTDCGPEYVDVAIVRLPWTRDTYRYDYERAEHVAQQVESRIAGMIGKWNTLVYADGLYADDGVTGAGLLTMDDSPGAINDSNSGGATAMIWGDGSDEFGLERQTTFLHEITHNMGAVQDSAPNSTRAGHCFEMYDVMCYDDGGPASFLTFTCAEAFPLPYECGSDDYFSPAPAPGSYLATHWNVYDSAFLCPVATCVTVPGSTAPPTGPGTTPPPAPNPTPPVDPGAQVSPEAQAWLSQFLTTAAARVKKVGLRGLARGKAVSIRGSAPSGYAVQVDLMWGAAAIAGGSLDAAGAAKLKVPRVHRKLLGKRRKVRLILQGVIRSAAGGGPPSLAKVAVTLKAPANEKRRR